MRNHGRDAKDMEEIEHGIDMSPLWRLAGWGSAAAVSLAIAVIGGFGETAAHRTAAAARVTAAPQFDARAETRKLSAQMRALAADRDRLQMRIATLEHHLDDVTGSVKREISDVRAATAARQAPAALPQIAAVAPAPSKPKSAPVAATAPPAPAATVATPATSAKPSGQVPLPRPGPEVSNRSAGHALAAVPLSGLTPAAKKMPAPASTATQTRFGIDLGGAGTIEALRAQWQAIRHAHAKLLEGLWPIVSIHDVAKRHTVRLRLVVGPFTDARAAAKLCAALVSAGLHSCRTAAFEGQRLALR
jgi:hypothetical protein